MIATIWTGFVYYRLDIATPQIRSIAVESGEVTLHVSDSDSGYNVKFSSDGLSWVTVATNVKGNVWTTRLPGGMRGFYRLSKP